MADTKNPTVVRYASKMIDLFVDEYPRYPEGLGTLPPNLLPMPEPSKEDEKKVIKEK